MKNNSWIPVTEKLPPALETYETQMRKREIMVYKACRKTHRSFWVI